MKFKMLLFFGKGNTRSPSCGMRYDQYQAQGWPIGTGVVAGTCGHWVKDRIGRCYREWN